MPRQGQPTSSGASEGVAPRRPVAIDLTDDLEHDVSSIARIEAITTILNVVASTTGMGFCAVARVTDKQWVACAVKDLIQFGLKPGGQLDLVTTICNEIRQHGELVVIDDVPADTRYCEHHTPRQYGFKSYISAPIHLPGGEFFGTLCAIDPAPHKLDTPAVVGMFRLFADLIGQHLDAQRRAERTEAALLSEREAAQLREQFIAVLGHDLRTPLAAIRMSASLLPGLKDRAEGEEVSRLIVRSARRMSELIDNVLDLARARLGGGLTVSLRPTSDLAMQLAEAASELRAAHPARELRTEIEPVPAALLDAPRIVQLTSNLLANALAHGDPAAPVRLGVAVGAGQLRLEVRNTGPEIPRGVRATMFNPFVRGGGGKGLGLGLYIASQIARAHGGRLEAACADGQTTFTFTLPLTLG
jgi:signal transduction histidine kinase